MSTILGIGLCFIIKLNGKEKFALFRIHFYFGIFTENSLFMFLVLSFVFFLRISVVSWRFL